MKTGSVNPRQVAARVFFIGLLAALWPATQALAINPQPEPPKWFDKFGLINVAPMVGVRINVSNTAIARPTAEARAYGVTAPSCSARVKFIHNTGVVLLAKDVVLAPGKTLAARFDNDDSLSGEILDESGSLPVRVDVSYPQTAACATILSTMELVNINTAQTQLILNPAVKRGINPQPEPPVWIFERRE